MGYNTAEDNYPFLRRDPQNLLISGAPRRRAFTRERAPPMMERAPPMMVERPPPPIMERPPPPPEISPPEIPPEKSRKSYFCLVILVSAIAIHFS